MRFYAGIHKQDKKVHEEVTMQPYNQFNKQKFSVVHMNQVRRYDSLVKLYTTNGSIYTVSISFLH